MIEVIFLGVGAAIPMRNGTNAAYLVRAGNENILIDCGPAILQQLDAVGISPAQITHVFFTHRHGDHVLGYPMLMLWYELSEDPKLQAPTLIASPQTFDALDALMAVSYGTVEGVAESAPRISVPQESIGRTQIHPNIMLTTAPMAHSDFAPSLGLRIETRNQLGKHVVAFTGDTGPNDNIALLGRDAELLVHEATYSATLNPEYADGAYGHSTAQIAGRNARTCGAQRLALVHIDAIYEGREHALIEEAQREFDGHVFVPVAGLSITLGDA
ncbi:MAG: MBL fold metallo-hydrolase [Thermoflexales bacterium]|nr:MBL fold metallo-hydrolase [Thermoflexales bacterium]MDW8351873.1 MBL fold metallo-hydrolase [Anaerolineae bacterium]